VSQAAWREKPTFMVVATKDAIIPPQMESDQVKAAKATAIEVPSSHVAMLSFPKDARFVEAIGNEFSFADLFDTARRIVDCPKHCATSCPSCPRHYQNRRIWDALNRHAVGSFLSEFDLKEIRRDSVHAIAS
jgi:hypothetical protein